MAYVFLSLFLFFLDAPRPHISDVREGGSTSLPTCAIWGFAHMQASDLQRCHNFCYGSTARGAGVELAAGEGRGGASGCDLGDEGLRGIKGTCTLLQTLRVVPTSTSPGVTGIFGGNKGDKKGVLFGGLGKCV